MVPSYTVISSFLTLALVKGCSDKDLSSALACLKKFFGDTGQQIPPRLNDLLSIDDKDDNPGRRKRDGTRRPSYKTAGFREEWCDELKECFDEHSDKCLRKFCYIMQSFEQVRASAVCDIDLNTLVPPNGNCSSFATMSGRSSGNGLHHQPLKYIYVSTLVIFFSTILLFHLINEFS